MDIMEGDFRVLIVDDETEIVRSMLSNLKALTGYYYEGHDNPAQARQAFFENPFHLVLTDISMPAFDGFELMKLMKGKSPSTDFIIITAHKSPEVVSMARDLGAVSIFYKPIDLEYIINDIEIMHKRYLYWLKKLAAVS